MSKMVDEKKTVDPTRAPEFQKVIRHFVTTPHKPHEPLKKREPVKPSPRRGSNEKEAEKPNDGPETSR